MITINLTDTEARWLLYLLDKSSHILTPLRNTLDAYLKGAKYKAGHVVKYKGRESIIIEPETFVNNEYRYGITRLIDAVFYEPENKVILHNIKESELEAI